MLLSIIFLSSIGSLAQSFQLIRVRSPLKYLHDEPKLKDVNFLQPGIPDKTYELGKNVIIEDIYVTPKRLPNLRVFVRRAKPPKEVEHKGDLILLPGTLQTSHMWAVSTKVREVSSMKLFAAAGYNTYAVDVPGVIGGKSIGLIPPQINAIDAMQLVVDDLGLKKPIFLSATGSGLLGIPYVDKYSDRLTAFISAAACCSIGNNWSGIEIPILIIRGELDILVPQSQFMAAPMHNVVIVPGATVQSWSSRPALFHAAVINFMDSLFEGKREQTRREIASKPTPPMRRIPSKAGVEARKAAEAKTNKVTKQREKIEFIPKETTETELEENEEEIDSNSSSSKSTEEVEKENSKSEGEAELYHVPAGGSKIDSHQGVKINPALEAAIRMRSPTQFQLNLLKTTLLSKGKVLLAQQIEAIQKKFAAEQANGKNVHHSSEKSKPVKVWNKKNVIAEEQKLNVKQINESGELTESQIDKMLESEEENDISELEDTHEVEDDLIQTQMQTEDDLYISSGSKENESEENVTETETSDVLNDNNSDTNSIQIQSNSAGSLTHRGSKEYGDNEIDVSRDIAIIDTIIDFYDDLEIVDNRNLITNATSILNDKERGGYFFDWKNEDFEKRREKEHMPKYLRVNDIAVKHDATKMRDGSSLFYREAKSITKSLVAKQVLLLHDRRITSNIWELQDTMKILAAADFDAYAVDLPGHGRSTGFCHPLTCLNNVIRALDLHKPVLIVPGWAGKFAMPYLFSHYEDLSGILLMSPTTADEYPKQEYKNILLPTLAIHSDRNSKTESKLTKPFKEMPNGQELILREALGRPYLLSVDRFHTILLNFVQAVAQSTSPL